MGHDASIKTVVQSNALGFLRGSAGLEKIIIRYYQPDTFAVTAYNWPGNLVEVSVENFQWKWIVPLQRRLAPSILSPGHWTGWRACPPG